MICNVAFDDELARVRISATEIDGEQVTVERSTDQVNWTVIRGGNSIDTTGTSPNAEIDPPIDDYEFATSPASRFPSGEACPPAAPGVENFYRISAFDPETMLVLTGEGNSYASTPDSASLDITGDLDLAVSGRPDDWSPPDGNFILASKYAIDTGSISWMLLLNTDGHLVFRWSPDGSTILENIVTSDVPVGFLNGEFGAARVTLDVDDGSSNHVVTFYTGNHVEGPWQLLGSPVVTSGTTSIFAGTADVEIGAATGGSLATQINFRGDVMKMILKNGIDGTVVASPDFTDLQPGATSTTDDQGNVWTVQSGATIEEDPDPVEDPTIKEQCTVSITPILETVWLKSIFRPFLNRPVQVLADFDAVERDFRGGVFDILGQQRPIAVTDFRGSRRWTLRFATETPTEAFDVDVMLASGDPLFLQIPGDSTLPIPSMHIVVDQSTAMLKRFFSDKRAWTLPFVEVQPPGPDVIGSTSTWQTVINAYATWQDVIDDNATWTDVLELVGDGSSVIVG